jgi:hypothetical protein
MRAANLIGLLLSSACASTPSADPALPSNQQRLELTEGRPTQLADGTVLEIKGIGYLHLPDSKNLSTATVVLRRGSEQAEVPLAREHGGSDPESSGGALGWELTLEVSDPYRQPSRAVILAVPRPTSR